MLLRACFLAPMATLSVYDIPAAGQVVQRNIETGDMVATYKGAAPKMLV